MHILAVVVSACPPKSGVFRRTMIVDAETVERGRIMFYKHHFTVVIDHDTAQDFRNKCAEFKVRTGHALRCLLQPPSIDELYKGDRLDFDGIPRLPGERLIGGENPDRLTVNLTPAMYDVFTRYAIAREYSRSELARMRVFEATRTQYFEELIGPTTWTLEIKCRTMLEQIGAPAHKETCTRCDR